jgi:hypothetical protein
MDEVYFLSYLTKFSHSNLASYFYTLKKISLHFYKLTGETKVVAKNLVTTMAINQTYA